MESEGTNSTLAIFQVFVLVAILSIIYYILVVGPTKISEEAKAQEDQKQSPFLIPKKGGALQLQAKDEDGYISLRLAKKIKVSEDTHIYRFAFQNE